MRVSFGPCTGVSAQVPGVVDTIGAAVGMTPFDLVFSGIGVFPPRGAPRACWIGIAGGVNALVALRKTLADRIEAVGIPLDARPYSPHLTLGRWREPRRSTRTQSPGDRPKDEHVEPRTSDRMKMMALSTGAQVARMCVERATLYQSRLSAAGSTYTALAHANLTAGSAVG